MTIVRVQKGKLEKTLSLRIRHPYSNYDSLVVLKIPTLLEEAHYQFEIE